ncbi:hypothetical protein GCM10009122_41070 [Fulvivirga kasyanovii]|uniref:Pyridoxamine 5'-phosphate oxidase n=1 Tax=Fulvivirga kasyanovii TaxID=396812 RepID=A0ABW9RV07_9BACT|nr:pyridoxamine 5'-phosphate oxidase family protein [Fulvivirga kasyanovii]MTI27522.1 pyridoxamine 5'-phosphate oxidase [Fulvivirga kasyanovii]
MENGGEQLRDDIASIEVAMLTTMDDNHNLRSRPMYTLQLDGEGVLWFFTTRNSPKLDEIEENNHVNLSYADANSHTYISITGSAVCVDDDERKEKFWSPIHEAWFPQGKDDPNLCLLKVRIKHVERWDTETSSMRELIRVEDIK